MGNGEWRVRWQVWSKCKKGGMGSGEWRMENGDLGLKTVLCTQFAYIYSRWADFHIKFDRMEKSLRDVYEKLNLRLIYKKGL